MQAIIIQYMAIYVTHDPSEAMAISDKIIIFTYCNRRKLEETPII